MMEVKEESTVFRALYWGTRLLASHANSALSRGIMDPDTLLRVLIRELSPSASSTSGLRWNGGSASVF